VRGRVGAERRHHLGIDRIAVPVHVVYRDPALPPLLAHVAASVVLLPADVGWFTLLEKLDALQRHTYAARLAGLTARQAQVLRLLGKGQSRAEIARQLRVAEGTVKEHVDRIESMLGVDRIAELRAISRLLDP